MGRRVKATPATRPRLDVSMNELSNVSHRRHVPVLLCTCRLLSLAVASWPNRGVRAVSRTLPCPSPRYRQTGVALFFSYVKTTPRLVYFQTLSPLKNYFPGRQKKPVWFLRVFLHVYKAETLSQKIPMENTYTVSTKVLLCGCSFQMQKYMGGIYKKNRILHNNKTNGVQGAGDYIRKLNTH